MTDETRALTIRRTMEHSGELTQNAPDPGRQTAPERPDRFQAFLTFLKRYLRVWAVGAAVLPLPIAKLHLIPVYESQRNIFATFVSLFCFLVAGYVFYCRHPIARRMFQSLRLNKGVGRRLMALLRALLIVAAAGAV